MTQWVSTVKNLLVGALRWLTYLYYWLSSQVYSLVGRVLGGFDLDSSGLRTIAEVQAAILAIVFSLSLFTMQQAASRYSSRIMAEYRRDRFTIILLISFVVNVVLALWIGSFQWDAQSVAQRLVFGTVLAWCSANLIALFPYYRHISAIVDPLELQARMHAEAVRAVQAVDREGLLRAVAAIGDIAVGTMQGGREQAIIEPVLDKLQDIFVQFYALKATDSTSYENLFLSKELRELAARDPRGWKSALFMRRVRCEPLGAILEQIGRLHTMAMDMGAGDMARRTAYRVIRILWRVGADEGNGIMIEQLLNEVRRLAMEAIRHESPSMYALGAHWYRDVVALEGYGPEFHLPYLPTISRTLFEINKLIVDEKAFDVFKAELSYLSIIRLPDHALGDLQSVLYRYVRALADKQVEMGQRWPREVLELPRDLISVLTPLYSPVGRGTFDAEFVEAQRVREDLGLNTVELGGFQELEREIGDALDGLEKVARTFEIFFVVGAYCIFKERFDFIKEIWTHTTPEDADAHWVNQNLVFFNAPYLIWQVYAEPLLEMTYDFGGYHGSGTYLKRYLILCLARCSGRPALPPVPANDEAKVSHYHTLASFLHDVPSLKELCDILIGEEAGLDPLFPGGAREALEKTKDYLKAMVSVCEERKRQVVESLPLEEQKLNELIRGVEQGHADASDISRIVPVIDYDEDTHGAFDFKTIRARIPVPREVVTKVGHGMMIGAAPRYVANCELEYLASKILSAKRRRKRVKRKPTAKRLLEAADRMRTCGYAPHTMLVPMGMRKWLFDNLSIKFEGGEEYVDLGEGMRCRISWMWEGSISRFIILGSDCGEWIIREPFSVQMLRDRGLEIDLLLQEEVYFDLRRPEATEVV